MLKIKGLDSFTRNVIIIFAASSFGNFINLLFQLLIAHKFSPADFAALNSLFCLFMIISTPLITPQMAVAKYCAEFNAHNQITKIEFFLSDLLKKFLVLCALTFLLFLFVSAKVLKGLNIPSITSGYLLAGLLSLVWISPTLHGAIQGLELFGWLACTIVLPNVLKLVFAFLFIRLGFKINGALGALLASALIGLFISYLPLRKFLHTRPKEEAVNYKEMLLYLFPVAVSNFCFIALVSSDMVLVRYFFPETDSGLYSLAQMVGKIFLFLPIAITTVMFPKTSGLNAKNIDTISTLKKSLFYVATLSIVACLFYNFFPQFVLKILTGKVFPESVALGRLFSISMTFFTLSYILIAYFLSLKDLRFIKYLILSFLLQNLIIIFAHQSLWQVQLVLCINAILLFSVQLFLAYGKQPRGLARTTFITLPVLLRKTNGGVIPPTNRACPSSDIPPSSFSFVFLQRLMSRWSLLAKAG